MINHLTPERLHNNSTNNSMTVPLSNKTDALTSPANVQTDWTQSQHFCVSQCGSLEYDWLTHFDSLTYRLRDISKNGIQHVMLNCGWQLPYEEEKVVFTEEVAQQSFWIREISWQYQGEVWILGRVVIPASTWQIHDYQLQKQQHRPIGELLFSEKASRISLELQRLTPVHPYYELIKPHIVNASPVWSRRSLFSFYKRPLLVSEIFLPQFFSSPLVSQRPFKNQII